MRKQYYLRPSPHGNYDAWDVDRLAALITTVDRRILNLESIRGIDESFGLGGKSDHLTWREFVDHMRLVQETDLRYPIILSADGRVMDGMHRVAKAMLEERKDIEAVQFSEDPEPDYRSVTPDELPYQTIGRLIWLCAYLTHMFDTSLLP